MVIFRENTEDVYCGIEFKSGSERARRVIDLLKEMGYQVLPSSGIGIKPMSPEGSKRLIRMAIRYALDKKLPTVTMMHKGNIMKFTEGAFKDWGYEVAKQEFRDRVITEDEMNDDKASALRGGAKPGNPGGRLLVKDRIADSMFQQIQLRPDEYSVIATPNLNGDYLSDAAAAMTGGIGLAAGANIGDRAALSRPLTARPPSIPAKTRPTRGLPCFPASSCWSTWAGTNRHLVNRSLEATFAESEDIANRGPGGKLYVTYDIARQFPGYGPELGASSSAFADRIIHHINKG